MYCVFSTSILTCNRYLCSRENNWEKSGVVAKFWQFSSGLILQNKTWINDCSFESESWQVIYNRENKNMSGSADAWLFEGGKKTGVSALFFITYLQVKGYSSCHTIVDKVWIQKVACCCTSSFEPKYEWEWLLIHIRCLFEDKKHCLVTGQRLHSTKQKLDTIVAGL